MVASQRGRLCSAVGPGSPMRLVPRFRGPRSDTTRCLTPQYSLTAALEVATVARPSALLSPLMSRLRRFAKKLTISAVSLGAVFVIGELVARASEPGPFSFFDRYPYVTPEGLDQERHIAGFTGRWDSTWYEIDERGFRGESRTPTHAEGELRIACVGDSCTFGKGVLEEDAWPRQLEARLKKTSDAALVFNMGINGADGHIYEAHLAEHVADLKPQAVVVGYNINDFPNTLRAVDEAVFQERGLRRIMPQGFRDALGRLALYRKARAVYYDLQKNRDMAASEATAKASAGEPIDDEVWLRERGYLERIRDMSAAEGASVVVFLFPYESQVILETYDRSPIERLAKLCESLDLPFVDLAEEFRTVSRSRENQESLFIPGDRYHPNRDGYAIVADRVMKELRGLGIIAGS